LHNSGPELHDSSKHTATRDEENERNTAERLPATLCEKGNSPSDINFELRWKRQCFP
jgi:hypothetical protein